MTGANNSERRRGWIRNAPAWLFVYLITLMPIPWEPSWLWPAFLEVNADFVVLLCASLMIRSGLGDRWWTWHLVVVATLFVPLYRFGHTLIPAFFDRKFVPLDDVLLLPSLGHLLTHEASTAKVIGVGLASLIVAALLYFATYLSVRRVTRSVARPRLTILCFGCAQLLVAGYWVDRSVTPRQSVTWLRSSMFGVAGDDMMRELRSAAWQVRQRLNVQRQELDTHLSKVSGRVDGLRGADVFVIFIESMGRVAMGDPRVRGPFEAVCTELEAKLSAANVASSSGWLTTGHAASKGAHMQLMTGIYIDGLRMYNAVLNSGTRTLAHYLADAGYRTINVQPAVNVEWPQSQSALGFEYDLFRMRLPYQGWRFHWGVMPDQYALAYLLQTEGGGDRPVFAQYVSVTSHAPFRDIPRYYDNWQDVTKPDAFAKPDHSYPMDWGNYYNHPDQVQAYVDTIVYSMRTVAGFAMQAQRPAIVLALGDHAPPVPFDGDPQQSMDVPVFALSNTPGLLAKFDLLSPGLIAPANGPAMSTKFFLPWLLTEFETEDADSPSPRVPRPSDGK